MTTPAELADLIRAGIRDHELAPGSTLLQAELARRFDVSRNPVREALRTLAAEGLVTLVPGGRARVRELGVADLTEIYDLRLSLEPALAPWIVDEARGRDVDDLRAAAERMAALDDLDAWMRENFAFHQRLYTIAGRPHTARLLTGLLTLAQPYSTRNVASGGRGPADAEHAGIVAAVAGRDAEGLAAVLTTHLTAARERLTSAPLEET